MKKKTCPNMFKYKSWNPGWKTVPYALGAVQAAASYGRPGPNQRYVGTQRNNNSITLAQRPLKKRRVTSFKRKVMSVGPAKHYGGNPTVNPMVHGTLYTYSPTQAVVQGTTNATRIGDSIEIEALKVNGYFNSATPTGAYAFRILVGWSGEEYATATDFISGLGATEIFLPNTTTNWLANGIVNPKAFTCLYDEKFDINSMIASASENQSFAFTVPIKQQFVYQSSGSVYGKTKNLYIVVMANVFGGTTGTTTVGAAFASIDLIFKE